MYNNGCGSANLYVKQIPKKNLKMLTLSFSHLSKPEFFKGILKPLLNFKFDSIVQLGQGQTKATVDH